MKKFALALAVAGIATLGACGQKAEEAAVTDATATEEVVATEDAAMPAEEVATDAMAVDPAMAPADGTVPADAAAVDAAAAAPADSAAADPAAAPAQ